jgi:hypothetical protein
MEKSSGFGSQRVHIYHPSKWNMEFIMEWCMNSRILSKADEREPWMRRKNPRLLTLALLWRKKIPLCGPVAMQLP